VTVLIVDDDPGLCETLDEGLRLQGFDVHSASSGCQAMSLARRIACDLVVLDIRLPDISGLELMLLLRDACGLVPFLVMSGFMDVETAVRAMKMGAAEILEKPLDLDEFTNRIRSFTIQGSANALKTNTPDRCSHYLPATAQRWAKYVMDGSNAERDPKTLGEWARTIGVSYSSLGESCRVLDIHPHAARDLVRALRALKTAEIYCCRPEMLLDISDRRTRSGFIARAGAGFQSAAYLRDARYFLFHQGFIPLDNFGCRALFQLISTGADD